MKGVYMVTIHSWSQKRPRNQWSQPHSSPSHNAQCCLRELFNWDFINSEKKVGKGVKWNLMSPFYTIHYLYLKYVCFKISVGLYVCIAVCLRIVHMFVSLSLSHYLCKTSQWEECYRLFFSEFSRPERHCGTSSVIDTNY